MRSGMILNVFWWKHWYPRYPKTDGFHGWFLFPQVAMDSFKRKSTGNHRFLHEIWGFPVVFSLKPIN